MNKHVSALSDEIKAIAPDSTAFLQAAYDANDAEFMAVGITSHKTSVELQRETISRLFDIGFGGATPSRIEVAEMRKIAGLILDLEGGQ